MRRRREEFENDAVPLGRRAQPGLFRRDNAHETANLRALFDAALQRRQDSVQAESQVKRVRRRVDIACAPPESHDTDQGDANYAGIMRTLDSFGMRSEDQKKFHNMFMGALLPHVYGGRLAWPQVAERVMARLKIDKIQSEVFVLTPRRWGKTTSVAMFVAAVMLNVPGITVSCYSVAKRASTGLMAKVCEYISMVEGGMDRVIVRNVEALFVSERPPQPGVGRATLVDDKRTSKFWSYPAGADREYLPRGRPTLLLVVVPLVAVVVAVVPPPSSLPSSSSSLSFPSSAATPSSSASTCTGTPQARG